MVSDANRYRENLEKGVSRLRLRNVKYRNSAASKENIETILRFDAENNANNLRNQTRTNYLVTLHAYAEHLQKDFDKVIKDDVINYVNSLKSRGLKDQSISSMKARIRKFHLWLNGGKRYPTCVAWIKGERNYIVLDPNKILSQNEIVKLIQTANNNRDKAIVACLYESGCRAGEFLGIRLKDITFTFYGAKVRVNGKTGERSIVLVNSIPYLKEWLKVHPRNSDKEAPLWPNCKNYPKNTGWCLTYNGLQRMLHKIEKRASLGKNARPHIFRHSRATHLASKMPEAYLRKIMGWREDSEMVKIYVNLNEKNVDDVVLEKVYGVKGEEAAEASEALLPKTCSNCGEKNVLELDYCSKCNFPLNEDEIKAREKQMLSMITPDILEQMIEEKVKDLLAKRVQTI